MAKRKRNNLTPKQRKALYAKSDVNAGAGWGDGKGTRPDEYETPPDEYPPVKFFKWNNRRERT